jgi:hypothetical protein
MPPSEPLKIFLTETPPKNIRLLAARGLVPLSPAESVQLLVHLLQDAEPEVSGQAAETLRGWSDEQILDLVKSPDCDAKVLDYFSPSPSESIREAILANPATPAKCVALLAQEVSTSLLEIILYNRVRLLEFPEILAGIKLNPNATADILRLVREIETEFFGAKKSEYRVEAPAEESPFALEGAPIAELEEIPEDLSLEGLPLDPAAREQAILERLARMSVRDKIKLALMGTREERGILIRDSNREIAKTVLKSPKLSDNEIESFAAMRNISDDILRDIGTSREWTKRYNVVQNLVRNPRTPLLIAQRLISRLQAKDLMLLSRDRGVSESVRVGAQRAMRQRNPHR